MRDATHVLDGLLYHESDLRIEEHYTDTAGFTDHVFALCHLLGFRFAPRRRDLADKRLYVPGKPKQWTALSQLIGGSVKRLRREGRTNRIGALRAFDAKRREQLAIGEPSEIAELEQIAEASKALKRKERHD